LEKKKTPTRHSSGNDQNYTIFDALLDSLKKKDQKEPTRDRLLKFVRSPLNILFLSMIFLGFVTLVWAGEIIWTDLTFYGKDLFITLLGSRIGENISLGIDFRLIFYLLIGFNLLTWSLAVRYMKK